MQERQARPPMTTPFDTINAQSLYEIGILSADTRKYGQESTNPKFSKQSYAGWGGGSMTLRGEQFIVNDSIVTFSDFFRQNPLQLPPQKTFHIYAIEIDGNGERKARLVTEGIATPQPPMDMQSATPSTMSDGAAPTAAVLPLVAPQRADDGDRVSAQRMTINELSRTLDVLRAQHDAVRQERDEERRRCEHLQQRIDQTFERTLDLERRVASHEADRNALIAQHTREIERLTEDHRRDMDSLRAEHERALAAAVDSARDEESSRLADEMDTSKAKFQQTVVSTLENLPVYVEVGKAILATLFPERAAAMQALPSIPAQQQAATATPPVPTDPSKLVAGNIYDDGFDTVNEAGGQ
jgi:hypothetical protein